MKRVREKNIIPTLAEVANFSTTHIIPSKVYADEGGIKQLYHGLSTCTGANPLAKARALFPRTCGQTVVHTTKTCSEVSRKKVLGGWMTCDFTSFSTVFQSYQDDGRLIMKGCVQWSSVYG